MIRRRNARAALLLLVLAVAGCSSGTPAAAPPGTEPVTHTIVMDATSFMPGTITVKVGERITWVNRDPFPHDVKSREAGFDSRSIAPGQSFSWDAKQKGEFPYVCSLHPTMTATLRVE